MDGKQPKIEKVNGYQIIEVGDRLFRVYDYEKQYGGDFASFYDAADFADTLPSREPPRG